MKLFTVGPVEMDRETLKIGGESLPYFRTPEFSAINLEIEQSFLKLLNAPKGSKGVLLTASGTGAMEAAVMNALSEKDRVLVVEGGGFGRRFSQLCQIHGIEHTPIRLKYDEALTREKLDDFSGQGYTALLVNIHETSTGQLYDAEMLGEFCRKNHLRFIVDAISSFLADPFDMTANGADLVIISSQKAPALPPGLSFIAVSPEMAEYIVHHPVKSLYFNLADYLKNMERGQTPFTPAVGILLQLRQRLAEIQKRGGTRESVRDIAEKASFFRECCDCAHMPYLHIPLSNALTPLVFQENAKMIFNTLKEHYGLMLTPNGGDLANTILRVGHIGHINKNDLQQVVNAIKEIN